MKTPNEIKDEVAKSHGWDDWAHVLYQSDVIGVSNFEAIENEAMEAYAQQFREGEKKGVSEQFPIEKCNSCGSKKVELIHRCKCGVEWQAISATF